MYQTRRKSRDTNPEYTNLAPINAMKLEARNTPKLLEHASKVAEKITVLHCDVCRTVFECLRIVSFPKLYILSVVLPQSAINKWDYFSP